MCHIDFSLHRLIICNIITVVERKSVLKVDLSNFEKRNEIESYLEKYIHVRYYTILI